MAHLLHWCMKDCSLELCVCFTCFPISSSILLLTHALNAHSCIFNIYTSFWSILYITFFLDFMYLCVYTFLCLILFIPCCYIHIHLFVTDTYYSIMSRVLLIRSLTTMHWDCFHLCFTVMSNTPKRVGAIYYFMVFNGYN